MAILPDGSDQLLQSRGCPVWPALAAMGTITNEHSSALQ